MINRILLAQGILEVYKVQNKKAPLQWKIKNTLRLSNLWGMFCIGLAYAFTRITGIPTITSSLRMLVKKVGNDGWIDYGIVSRRVVTTVGSAYIVDAWQNIVELENMKYHGCGTGGTAEAVGDTALITELTTALNPDSTRATGVQTESASNQLVSTATVTFDGSAAITEHGLFSQAATGGGVMFDRSLFSAVNVVPTESIIFVYTVTFPTGG